MIKSIVTTFMLLFSPILHAANHNNPCTGPLMTTQAMDNCGKAIDEAVQKKQTDFTQSFTGISPSASSPAQNQTQQSSPFSAPKQPTQPTTTTKPPASTTPEKQPFRIRFD